MRGYAGDARNTELSRAVKCSSVGHVTGKMASAEDRGGGSDPAAIGDGLKNGIVLRTLVIGLNIKGKESTLTKKIIISK